MRDREPKPGEARLSPLSFLLADVQNGMGPYITVFLKASVHWNAARIGVALGAVNVAQILAQTPAGALLDRLPRKRELIAVGAGLVALSCVAIALHPAFALVLTAQSLIGVAGAIFPAGVAAISLGLVGRARMDARTGRNQAWNAAGNVAAAVAIGLLGYFVSHVAMFYLIAALSLAAAVTVLTIPAGDIDEALASGADAPDPAGAGAQDAIARDGARDASIRDGDQAAPRRGLGGVFADRRVLTLLAATVLFHIANAAMLPLVTQLLASGPSARNGPLYTSAYMVASQLVWIGAAAWAGRAACTRGRKPTFLVAFCVLPGRGFLYTLSDRPWALIAVQALDGVGAGIFGVVSVLMIADLTRGSGRFNSVQGAMSCAQGCGALISNLATGALVKRHGFHAGFYVLSGVALVALAFFALAMPETRLAADRCAN